MDESTLLKSLRAGDESAFTQMVEMYHIYLVRLASLFVKEEAVAEELAQETWLAVLRGLDKFEGRSSLKTWITTILTNRAKTRGRHERRVLAFSELDSSPTVRLERFKPSSAGEQADHWIENPNSWEDIPEAVLLSKETLDYVHKAIDTLPENQRAVITLRDVDGLSSEEVCNVLGISETNQRVLLHRARAKVRQVLEDHLQPES